MRILRNVLYCILFPLSLLAVIGGIGCFIAGFIMNATGLGTDTAFFKFFNEPLTGGLTIFGSIVIGGIMLYVSFLLDPDFSSAHYDEPVYTPPAPVRRPTADSSIHGSVTIGGSHSRQSGSPTPSAPVRPTPVAEEPNVPAVPFDPFALGGSVLAGSIASYGDTDGNDAYADGYEDEEAEGSASSSAVRHGRLSDGGYTVGAYEYDRDGNMTGYTTESGNHYNSDGDFTGYDVGDNRYDEDGNATGYRVGDYEYDADGNQIGYYTPSGTFYETN